MSDRRVRSRRLNGLWTISTVFVVLVSVLSPYIFAALKITEQLHQSLILGLFDLLVIVIALAFSRIIMRNS